MSVNAMQRLSVPKKENYCSRNCLMKNISTLDHSKCIKKLEVSNKKIAPLTLSNSIKKFLAPLPTSKSTTFEKKYKSILAQREAEYDKNLKSIKVRLFTSTNTFQKIKSTTKSGERPLTYRPNRMTLSQNLLFTRRERSRTKGSETSLHKSLLSDSSRIIERSEESHKKNETEMLTDDSVIRFITEPNKEGDYTNFMIKEQEIDLNTMMKNPEKIDLDLLDEKEDPKMLEIYMKDELLFKQKSSEKALQETVEESPCLEKIHVEQNLPGVFTSMIPSLPKQENKLEYLPTETKTLYTLEYFQDKINKINLGIFTLNYENLKTNLENKAKFSKEDYRKLLTTLVRFEYGKNILEDFHLQEELNERFLNRHMITERMRMKMIDWMIEVLSNYNCGENTYFLAVNILDRYFQKTSDILKPDDLHILGICSMFISSKFYDVYPLKLKIVVEKIGHGKFSADEIKSTEEKIIKTLEYNILKPTCLDFIGLFYEEIFFSIENNFTIEEDSLSLYLESFFAVNKLKFDFNYEKFRLSKKFSPKLLNLLSNVIIYLAKMNLHDYSLTGVKTSLLGAASIFVGMKICEQINNEEYTNDFMTKIICQVSKVTEYDLLHCAQKILYNAQNFESVFSGLENLKKVHFNFIFGFK